MSAGAAKNAKKIITYVGRKTDFSGKTLWEIVGSLRSQGVGRLIERHMFARYPEPCFMKIVKVETCPDEERRRVRVWVEKTFRGNKLPKPVEIYGASYKPDYRLIPKNEEAKYLNNTLVHKKADVALPIKVEMPPLMKESIIFECARKGIPLPSEFVMPLSYNNSPNRLQKIATKEDKVEPFKMKLGTPLSPTMYKGVPL